MAPTPTGPTARTLHDDSNGILILEVWVMCGLGCGMGERGPLLLEPLPFIKMGWPQGLSFQVPVGLQRKIYGISGNAFSYLPIWGPGSRI